MEKRDKEFLMASIKYLGLGFIIYWLLRTPRLIELEYDYVNSTNINISLLRWPLLTIIAGFYLSRVIEYLFSGAWVTPIRRNTRYAGILGSVYLLVSSPSSPDSLRYTSNILLTGFGAIILLHLTEKTYGQKKKLILFSAKSLMYLVFGVTGALMTTRIPEIYTEGLDIGFLVLGCVSSTLVFLKYFEGQTGRISKYLDALTQLPFSILFAATLYCTTYRQLLIRVLGSSHGFVYLFELIAVCFVGFTYYRRFSESQKVMITELKGNWTRHVQEIKTRSDVDLDRWDKLVNDFLETGEKTRLILYITELYRKNGVTLEQINLDIKDLMNYNEPEEPLQLANRTQGRDTRQRQQREAVLNHVISEMQERIL